MGKCLILLLGARESSVEYSSNNTKFYETSSYNAIVHPGVFIYPSARSYSIHFLFWFLVFL